jgi:Co/Zn/Cd efflux system component
MGYHRAEILGAIIAILLIWGLLVWLLIEAYYRVLDPPYVDAPIMLITAIVGFCCNLINFFALEGQCCVKKDEEEESNSPELDPNQISTYFNHSNDGRSARGANGQFQLKSMERD